MPINDWTRVDAGIFHHFHVTWISELTKTLNNGILPTGFYALAEQQAGRIGPDVLTLQTPTHVGADQSRDLAGTLAVDVAPPKVRIVERTSEAHYAARRRTLAIRHVSRHQLIALIEVVSPGNKASRQMLRSLIDKAVSALAQGIHLMILDLFPPGRGDPQGIHGALWNALTGKRYRQPAGEPLTLASYVGGADPVAYVEPRKVGSTLPDMPLFLHPEQYVNVPLEKTYQEAYASVPSFYQDLLNTGGRRTPARAKKTPPSHRGNGKNGR